MITAAEALVDLLVAYAALGVVFAIAFVAIGVARVDPVAKDSGMGFRFIIFPGVAALWTLLLARWIQAARSL